jgi:hypothetical protein
MTSHCDGLFNFIKLTGYEGVEQTRSSCYVVGKYTAIGTKHTINAIRKNRILEHFIRLFKTRLSNMIINSCYLI